MDHMQEYLPVEPVVVVALVGRGVVVDIVGVGLLVQFDDTGGLVVLIPSLSQSILIETRLSVIEKQDTLFFETVYFYLVFHFMVLSINGLNHKKVRLCL